MPRSVATATYLSALCMELYHIQHSGISTADGLYMLVTDDNDTRSKALLQKVYESVDNSVPLSSAMRQTGDFPDYMCDTLELAERTGNVEQTLMALSEYYERRERLTVSIKNAVVYPVLLLVLMLVVIVVLITGVLPIFNDVFNNLGMEMSSFALALMNFGNGLSGAASVIAIVIAVLAVAALLIWLINPLRKRVYGLFNRAFGGRGVMGRVASARFASAMAMASSSGLDAEESVMAAAKICGGSGAVDSKTTKCVELLRGGKSISEAISEAGILSKRNCRMVTIAEKSGSLSEVLAEVARRSDTATHDEIDTLIGRIEPTLVIITSLLVGVILLSVMLPLMSIMTTIG